jgi:hypothetical protein
MAKLDRNRAIFGTILVGLIAAGEIIIHHLHLPTWPVFFVMVFFFLAHMDIKVAPNIIIGSLVGIGFYIIARPIIVAIMPITGVPMGRLLYVLAVVFLIAMFREILPIVLNDYTFAFLLLSGLASKVPPSPPKPITWMLVTLIGGTICIFFILGIRKIVVAIETKRVKRLRRAAAAARAPIQ